MLLNLCFVVEQHQLAPGPLERSALRHVGLGRVDIHSVLSDLLPPPVILGVLQQMDQPVVHHVFVGEAELPRGLAIGQHQALGFCIVIKA